MQSNSSLVASTSHSFDSPHSGRERSKQMKRKYSSDESEDESLVLLSNVEKQYKTSSMSNTFIEKNSTTSEDSDYILSLVGESSSVKNEFSDAEVTTLIEEMKELYGDIGKISNASFLAEDPNEIVRKAQYDSDMNDQSDNEIFYEKKYEYHNQIKGMARKKRKLHKDSGSIKIEPIPSKNMVIILIDHPGSVTLYQYMSVEVLSGKIAICGNELTSQSPLINVFSSESTGLLELKTLNCENLWMKKTNYHVIYKKLVRAIGNRERTKKILKKINSTTVIVILEKLFYQAHLQFVELYFPNVLKFHTKKFIKKSFVSKIESCSGSKFAFRKNSLCFIDKENKTLKFDEDVEDLAAEVVKAVRTAHAIDVSKPRILVYGSKNTGKSTLLKFLVNKTLTYFSSVYYLDCDPGQPEFTPPGVVSFSEVNRPIVGPSFCHQRDPILMCFTGGVSADLSPLTYTHNVAKLMYTYKHHDCKGTLFVNTMGWMKGIGLTCLKNVMKSVKPTILIEMVNDEDTLDFDYRKYAPKGVKFYQIHCSPHRASQLTAEECRSLSLLSYIGKCQIPHEKPKYINSFRPFCVCWDDIPMYSFHKRLVPYRLIESINASVVALCKVDRSTILCHKNEMYPMTLEEEPENECIGFGIVRAVDEVNHLLYIVTPLKSKELKKVNAIIKGNIMIPNSVFLEQPMGYTTLNFTQEEIKVINSEEAPSTEVISDITKKYRKGIKERYGVNNKQK